MALQNLRSNTANKRPTASGMVDGQVAINTNATNPGLFFKDASDGIRKVGPVFIGSSAPNSSPATGGSTGHSIGEQWLDTSGGRYVLKTWDGTAWRDDDSNYLQLTGGALSGALTIDNAANVSALDLKFDGDTDTGFYAPAANTLGFVGGGTERLRIDSSGNVGIGTTSPSSYSSSANNLVVQDTAGEGGITIVSTTTGASNIFFADTAGTTQGQIKYQHSGDYMRFYTNATERLRIDSSGNVGIGTSSPSYPLHVNGNAQFGTGSAWKTDTDLFKSTATGGANIRSASGSASTPTYSLVGDEDTGVYFPAANAVAVSTAGSQRLLIDSLGRVGINTTTNQADLDVNGSGSGTIRIGSSSTSRSVITHVNNSSNSYLSINVDEGENSTANTHFKIFVDNSEKFRITHEGRVGIGTASPNRKLQVAGSTAITNSGDTGAFLFDPAGSVNTLLSRAGQSSTAAVPLAVKMGNTERMRIDSSGRLLVGVSSALDTSAEAIVHIADTLGARLVLARKDTSVSDGNGLGGIRFAGNDTTSNTFTTLGEILCQADGTHAAGDNPTRLTFKTTPDGSSTVTERMRIDSSGNVGIGVTNPGSFSAKAETLVLANGGDHVGITLDCDTDKEGSIYFADGSSGDNLLRGQIVYNHSGDSLRFVTNASEQMRIDSSGDVGIGTTNPAYKLTVEGTIAGSDSGTRFIRLFNDGTVPKILAGPSQPLEIGAADDSHLRIDADGDIGIGTLSPNAKLHVAGTTRIGANDTTSAILEIGAGATGNRNAYIDFVGDTTYSDFGLRIIRNNSGPNTTSTIDHRGTGPLELKTREASALRFMTSNTERARLTSAGNIGIGTSTPESKLEISRSTADDNTDLRVKNFRPGIRFIDISSSASDAELVMDGGALRFRISEEVNASTALTERMRLNSSGQLGVGTTSPAKKLHVNGEAFVTGNTFFHSTNSSAILAGTAIGKYFQTDGNLISGKTTTNGNTHQAFCNPNGIVGTIRTSGSATQYNTSSDYRLKENVVDIADGITRVKQLQPKRFNFIADADTIVDGFIAHEAQTVVPEAVSGTHNEVDEDGKAVMQGIDQSKLVPLLTAALKEAIAKIETLETKVAALEAQ